MVAIIDYNSLFTRVVNLELLSEYGVGNWRNHCDVLQNMFDAQQRKHAELK